MTVSSLHTVSPAFEEPLTCLQWPTLEMTSAHPSHYTNRLQLRNSREMVHMSSSNGTGFNALRHPSSRWVNSSIKLLRFNGPGCILRHGKQMALEEQHKRCGCTCARLPAGNGSVANAPSAQQASLGLLFTQAGLGQSSKGWERT